MIFGCKDTTIENLEEATQENSVANKFKEKTGILKFENFDELGAFIEKRIESKEDLLDKAKEFSEEGRYNPLLLIYNLEADEAEKLGIKEEKVAKVASYDDMLLLLLNENGEIQVSEKIYRINGDFVYEYQEGASEEIKLFLEQYTSGKISLEREQTLEFSEKLTVYMHNNKEVEEGSDYVSRGDTQHQFLSNTNWRFRMRAKQFDGYWYFYSSIGASTEVLERKRFWFITYWTRVVTDLRLDYRMSYRARAIHPFYGSYNSSRSGSNHQIYKYEAKEIFDYCLKPVFGPAPYKYTGTEGSTSHTAFMNNGVSMAFLNLQY